MKLPLQSMVLIRITALAFCTVAVEFKELDHVETLCVIKALFIPQHAMKHLNLQPLDSHGVDFSRVRMWNLNGWAKHYRQTLVFSSIQEPQINNILTKYSFNYRGQVRRRSEAYSILFVGPKQLLHSSINGK